MDVLNDARTTLRAPRPEAWLKDVGDAGKHARDISQSSVVRHTLADRWGHAPEFAHFANAIELWGSYPETIQRGVSALYKGQRPSSEAPSDWGSVDTAQLSQSVFDALKVGAHQAPQLFRGIAIDGSPLEVARQFLTQETVTWEMSSLTEDPGVAEYFASRNTFRDNTRVIFHIDQGSRGLNLGALARRTWEREWLAGGTYQIAGVKIEDRTVHIRLQQKAHFGQLSGHSQADAV